MGSFRNALTQYDDFYDMLSDGVRMRAYEQAIKQTVKPGDVVIDLGAGTGILGFLALKAGAARVYAIEKSDAIDLARSVAEKNGFLDRMTFLNEPSKNVTLPEKADVLVSETLGSFGIDENTLPVTIDARNRFLKPNGIVLPQGIKLYLAPVEAPDSCRKIDFWRMIHGIDFSPAREVFVKKLMIESISQSQLLAEHQCFADFDFNQENSANHRNTLLLNLKSPGVIHGFAGWFELSLADGVSFSTAPDKPATHWKQAFFPIADSINVIAGDILELTMNVEPQSEQLDGTQITYHYRCSQLANETSAPHPKVGRNDPCPCGSGLKFKKCCG